MKSVTSSLHGWKKVGWNGSQVSRTLRPRGSIEALEYQMKSVTSSLHGWKKVGCIGFFPGANLRSVGGKSEPEK